ncbi:MAG: Uma2 family endonuclease [Chryseolinea sp.]
MKSSIEYPPRTIMEVYKNLPEGTLAELIENVIYMSPSPASTHQRVLNKINNVLFTYLEEQNAGEVFIAPFDVYLDESSNAVQPDIIVVLKANANIVEPNGHIHGVPDLLIEILSPGNKDHDLVKKKELYERFGVKEYWIVDPQTKRTQGFQLKGKIYQVLFEGTGNIQSTLLDLSFAF